MCTLGGSATSARAASSASAWPTGSQRISACTVGTDASATTATTPPPDPRRGAHQRRGGHPPAQRVLGRAQVLTAQQRPAVQQQRRPVPADRLRFGTGRRDHQHRAGVDLRHHRFTGRRDHRRARKRTTQLLGRPTGSHHHGADRIRSTRTAAQCGIRPATPAAYRRSSRPVVQRQWAGAVPAAGDRPAASARQRRDVAPPRHLHQDRRLGLQRAAGGTQCDRWQPRGARRRVAFVGVTAVVEGHHPRGPLAHHRPRRNHVVRPAAAHQRLRLGGSGVSPDQCGATHLVGTQHRHLACVRIRGPRLGQRVVAVVPQHDQTEIAHRREHRAASADHQPRAAPQRSQPAPVARGRTQARRQRDHAGLVEQHRRGAQQRLHVALIRNDRQHGATGAHGLGSGLGKPVGPHLAGQRLPHRAGSARLGECGQELTAAAVQLPIRFGRPRRPRKALASGAFRPRLWRAVAAPPAAARRRGCRRSGPRRHRRDDGSPG